MLQMELKSKDINMGNEDTWTLVFDEIKGRFHVNHWWSHRKGGSLDFNSGSKEENIEQHSALIAQKLMELGFRKS